MAALHGIVLAPDDLAFAPSPTWQRIDTVYNVASWSIDRGRQTEMSRTDSGTATVQLWDKTGDFDPTNTSGAYYGLGPPVQAAIALQNPVDLTWSTLFRGFISSVRWTPYVTEQFANVELQLVDALALFAAAEMPPLSVADGGFGDDFVDGNIVFNEDTGTDAVQTRINKVLDMLGWDPGLRNIFTGNVKLQKTTYAPRSTVSQVMADAADAEFPDVSNLYIGGPANPGKVVFHGRQARFHPATYGLTTWFIGDDAAAAANPATVTRISPPLVASIDDSLLYTSALATPQNVADADISAQYVQDDTAVVNKGLRTWSAENLATAGGAGGTTALQETKLFADYVRDNYATPRVRIGQVTIKSRNPHGPNGAATWGLLCGIDISHLVHLTTTHKGGGGFDEDFYVEGIHYNVRPGAGIPYIELVLDVSPRSYYDADPFTFDAGGAG